MALKDILVAVDTTDAAERTIQAAAMLAAEHDAHITGLFVVVPPQVPAYVSTYLTDEALAAQRKAAEDITEDAKAVFLECCQRTGVAERSEWRVARGNPTNLAAVHGRYADLVVIGQSEPDRRGDSLTAIPEDLLLASGRPVMVVPYAGRAQTIGRTVVLAWNASREAARAVGDALPLLQAAGSVHVLSVNLRPGPEGLGDEPGADIARHLARHGVKVEVHYVRSGEIEPGDVILNHAADVGADLIVMGAYGRSRIRELILGGATRSILQDMTVPVMFSH